MKTDNEFDKLGILLRNEIQKDGKLTRFGTLIILYTALALSISLPKLIVIRYLSKESEKNNDN